MPTEEIQNSAQKLDRDKNLGEDKVQGLKEKSKLLQIFIQNLLFHLSELT
jgi:hypothetical protein